MTARTELILAGRMLLEQLKRVSPVKPKKGKNGEPPKLTPREQLRLKLEAEAARVTSELAELTLSG